MQLARHPNQVENPDSTVTSIGSFVADITNGPLLDLKFFVLGDDHPDVQRVRQHMDRVPVAPPAKKPKKKRSTLIPEGAAAAEPSSSEPVVQNFEVDHMALWTGLGMKYPFEEQDYTKYGLERVCPPPPIISIPGLICNMHPNTSVLPVAGPCSPSRPACISSAH
jgi:hypothetical protein